MNIDVSKIKPGDELTLTVIGVVRSADNLGGVAVMLRGGTFETAFSAGEIEAAEISHTPKDLAVGDRVHRGVLDLDEDGKQRVFTITAIDADGWVLLGGRGSSSRVTSSLPFLERA